MIRPTSFLLAIPFVTLLAPANANAALERCGGVFLSGDAQCEFRREQDCKETCEVVSVEHSCAAELYTSCESGCATRRDVPMRLDHSLRSPTSSARSTACHAI